MAKATNIKTGRTKAKGCKVWHITRFIPRYELADDVRFNRQTPLKFTKDFVGSGTDDESCSYFRQIMSLRTRPNWLALRGAFAELKNISANSSKVYRGYLLDSNFQPASDEQIGSWLGLDIKESKELLMQLNQTGLIEQVTMPDFEQDNKSKKNNNTKKKTNEKSKGKTKVTGTKNTTENNLVDSRETTRKHECARGALNNKTKVKAKINAKINGNEKINEKINIGSINANIQEQKAKLLNQSPPTTQPIEPMESDEPGAKLIQFNQSPESVTQTRIRTGSTHSEPQRIGDIIRGIQHRYSPDAKAFAGDVFQALQLNCQPDSERGRRELASFASVWMDATYSGLSPPELDRLRERAIAEAVKIRKYWNNRQGKPAAVFCDVFKKLAKNAKQTKRCKV